ncbi:hypothetical protein [Paracoccus sp. (in: a-proteobacteria)]|nr:hypothetical protein [Paracoccus sp. (in: a-proteobacteria)]MDO5646331.1 hypothetical protein [Paracoccus sp. (in: a-proteobacteria)]
MTELSFKGKEFRHHLAAPFCPPVSDEGRSFDPQPDINRAAR